MIDTGLLLRERVAIVGSRRAAWPEPDLAAACVAEYVASLPDGVVVVSGGEPTGVDAWAESAARARGLDCLIYPADWGSYGPAAGPIRNRKLAEVCDRLVAFLPESGSRGTCDAITRARRLGKPVQVFHP